MRGHGLDDVQNHIAGIAGGGDIEESQLIGPLLVIAGRYFDRVARIAQLYKIDTFDHAAARDIKARNNSFSKHGAIVEVSAS